MSDNDHGPSPGSRGGNGKGEGEGEGEEQGQGDDPGLSTVFEVLARRRRRVALDHLCGTDGEWVPVVRLVERIEAREAEVADGTPDREGIRLSLCHGHLPTLADAGVVRYDRENGRVRYLGSDRLERFLDVAAAEGPPP